MKKNNISIISMIAGTVAGSVVVGKLTGKAVDEAKEMSNKHLELFLMMNQWVKVKQQGKELSAYFKKNGYKNIAIYGMSYAGETLLEELKESDIHVTYGIDKNAEGLYTDIDIVSMEEILEPVDIVVVTAITFFDEIKEQLQKKINCPIVSLEDILYEI